MSNHHAPARSEKPVAPVVAPPVAAPVAAGPKFIEVEVMRKISLDYIPDENGEMVRYTGEITKVALKGEVVRIPSDHAAKLLAVGAVRPTSHTFD